MKKVILKALVIIAAILVVGLYCFLAYNKFAIWFGNGSKAFSFFAGIAIGFFLRLFIVEAFEKIRHIT